MAIFLIGLLLKIAMTATIVVAASVVVECSGPFVGSLIASLPTAGGAAMIILGVWWSYAVGLSIGLAWNALLWLVRNWRQRKGANATGRAPSL